MLQIALQTKIKLFYRPESIKAKPNAVWQDQLVLNKTSGGYRIENPEFNTTFPLLFFSNAAFWLSTSTVLTLPLK